mmetsp:Transcript_23752/g.49809  ORF Transcript_23752/g.49809 Transcript_23752/m.49809 type:complete len:305 (-) Transcript_23752:531-1445(-)
MSHKDKGAKLLSALQILRPLIFRNGHVTKITDEDFLVLRTQIVLKSGKLLHLHPLEFSIISWNLRLLLHQLLNQGNGIPVLDPHKRTIHTLPQESASRLHIRGGHSRFQKRKVIGTPVQRIIDHELHKPLRLRHELIQRDERSFVLHVQKLREMLRRIGLFGAKRFLARVDLAESANGRFEGKLGRDGQTDLEFVSLGVFGEHEGRYGEGFPGSLAVADGHDVGIGELYVFLVHEEVDGHVEFGADAEDALGGLGAEPVEGEVAEGGHFFLGSLLEGVVDVIVDSSDDAEAGGHDFKVLSGGRG